MDGKRAFLAVLAMACALVVQRALAEEPLRPGIGPDDWPQFRGPNATGVSQGMAPLPVEFSSEQNVRWALELGDGVASPIVVAGRVYITAMSEADVLSVYALDARSGTLLWRRDLPMGTLPAITPPNSHASSTPACDGTRLYVYASTLGLLALSVEDGAVLWRHALPVPQYLMDWGAASSPIVWQDMVIFNQDDDLDSYLLALDAATGTVRWKTPRPEMLAGYAVPVICQAEGRSEIVIAGTGKLKGYDPQTGRELWTCNSLLRTIMTSPVVRGDMIYLAVQSYGDTDRTLKYALLEWKDTNQDRRITPEEIPPAFAERFAIADRDRNGALDEQELEHAFQSPDNMVGGGSTVQAVRGGGSGDVTPTHLVWQLHNRSPSNISSPLLVGEQLFMVKRGGLSSAFDAATGEPLWQLKRLQNLGEYYASPVAGDGKIYIAGENGFIVVLESGPQLKVLARNDVGGVCVATPAISSGAIYIRTRDRLYGIAADK
ncbi:MAG: PQQ-binding-like beta-propeller repeat protein [Pirellulales bacterium]|nr:PQQ-binding-like beta-propeller repeat protein [Pirellulales bacterium]